MKRTIAIVAGGDTSEFHVSLRSAQGIYSFIDKEKYTLYIVEMKGLDWYVQLPDGAKAPVDRNDFSFRVNGQKIVFDFAYITIHGTPGEDGRLQGYFDLLRIPYSCCGVLAASTEKRLPRSARRRWPPTQCRRHSPHPRHRETDPAKQGFAAWRHRARCGRALRCASLRRAIGPHR